jgi:hypothetical protein
VFDVLAVLVSSQPTYLSIPPCLSRISAANFVPKMAVEDLKRLFS